jgi:hypothetical protein
MVVFMPIMASLKFQMEDPRGESVIYDQTFDLLCNFLQPKTTSRRESTAQVILKILPENTPYSMDVAMFSDACIEVAEQIPYHHPSQLKLVDLLEYLGRSTKLVVDPLGILGL